MADIVERLRIVASHRNARGAAALSRDEITQAADEIERLRAAIWNWYIDPSIANCGMLERLAQENQTAPTKSVDDSAGAGS